jgi:perosamine synthetase
VSENRRIQLFRPVVDEDAIAAVADTLRSGWIGLGPRTGAFEAAFAEAVGAKFCVALNSCTTALKLALRVLDLPPGAEVVTSPLTFVSANEVIVDERLRPVFADVQPDTGCIDPASIRERLGARTGAIVVMHYGGTPCDLDEIYAIAREHGVAVIEDCAHACGAQYRGRPIGSHGDLHAFSFQAVKNLAVGDGGALTVASAEIDARLRRLRWFGISSSTFDRSKGRAYGWDYDVTEPGVKGAMNDIVAAIGLAQLSHLEAGNRRRREIVERYRARLEGVRGLELLREHDDRVSSNHLFCVLAERRDLLAETLASHGIEVGVHFRPSYSYAMFGGELLPGVESFWRRVVSLPLHLQLGAEDVDRVVDVIRGGW